MHAEQLHYSVNKTCTHFGQCAYSHYTAATLTAVIQHFYCVFSQGKFPRHLSAKMFQKETQNHRPVLVTRVTLSMYPYTQFYAIYKHAKCMNQHN